jgi:hypothetical protein
MNPMLSFGGRGGAGLKPTNNLTRTGSFDGT